MNTLPDNGERTALQANASAIAKWFYWIAGFTIFSVIATATGMVYGTSMGLFVPRELAMAAHFEHTSPTLSLVTGAIGAACFAGIGYAASTGALWAFVLGIVLYGIDAVLFGVGMVWFGLAFHVYILIKLFPGIAVAKRLSELGTASAAGWQPAQSAPSPVVTPAPAPAHSAGPDMAAIWGSPSTPPAEPVAPTHPSPTDTPPAV